jgi:hypothetical protein
MAKLDALVAALAGGNRPCWSMPPMTRGRGGGVNVGQAYRNGSIHGEGRLMGIFDIFSDQPARTPPRRRPRASMPAMARPPAPSTRASARSTPITPALQPYMQNYGTANAGVTQLGNVLG